MYSKSYVKFSYKLAVMISRIMIVKFHAILSFNSTYLTMHCEYTTVESVVRMRLMYTEMNIRKAPATIT